MDLGLEGVRALVTGASRGLGRACAEALTSERAAVFISSRKEDSLRGAAERMGACGYRAADLGRDGEAGAVIQAAVERLGGLDVLVANAGGPPAASFQALRDEDWEASYRLTLMSAVRLTREALPHLRKSGRGRVVFLTSLTVREPAPELILSNSLRAAVSGLAKTLATELAPEAVTVNCILPSRVLTDRLREVEAAKASAAGIDLPDQLERTASEVPMRRLGQPAEVGALCAFLCSEQAAFLTGQNIALDGGSARSVR